MIRLKTGREFSKYTSDHFEGSYGIQQGKTAVLGGVFDCMETGERVVLYSFLCTGEVFVATSISQELFQTTKYKRRGHVFVTTGHTGREIAFKEAGT